MLVDSLSPCYRACSTVQALSFDPEADSRRSGLAGYYPLPRDTSQPPRPVAALGLLVLLPATTIWLLLRLSV